MYRYLRPWLWQLEPETAHHWVLNLLHYVPAFCFSKVESNPVQAMGLTFRHAIGLAAGFDNNGAHLEALAKLGFAFIELGGVTPKPQSGNPKPRLFRLPKAHALINRMGFSNEGVHALVARVQLAQSKGAFDGVLGINIGKNKETALDHAVDDYVYCLRHVYGVASYVTINISSPNMPQLRQLQDVAYFHNLMSQLREEQLHLADKTGKYVPLVVKISPDESDESLKRMADVLVSLGLDGLIATNTTVDHEAVRHLSHGEETGGLSGQPLASRATDCLRLLYETVGDDLTLIASGGVDSAARAREKRAAGASLLQVYSGLVYEGPALISALAKAFNDNIRD